MGSIYYVKGMVDALQLWGTVCRNQGNCQNCPIGITRGANVTCQDFASKFPEKMLSILKEMNDGEISYYQEYCTRFPECNLTLEEISLCACRKALFEGYVDCEKAEDIDACMACWSEAYTSDVTEPLGNQEEDEDAVFCPNCGNSVAPEDRFCQNCGKRL